MEEEDNVSQQSQAIQKTVGGLVNQPQLATGTDIQPNLQQVGPGELSATPGLTTPAPAVTPQAVQTTAITPSTVQTSQQPTTVTPGAAQTFTADTQTAAAQAQAEQLQQLSQPAVGASGSITKEATVQGQLENITQDIESALAAGTPLPAFARGAQKLALSAMAQRGLSASTIAADAFSVGVLS